MPAVLDQKVSEFRLEFHPRIFAEYFLDQLPRYLIKTQSQEIEPGAEVDQGYLIRKPTRDSRRGVERDRLPNQIGALRGHLMLRTEFAGGIGTIHLETVVAAVGRNEPEVMQDRTAKGGFLIDHGAPETLDREATEDVRPHTMTAEKLG